MGVVVVEVEGGEKTGVNKAEEEAGAVDEILK